jgi:hypothetical protein
MYKLCICGLLKKSVEIALAYKRSAVGFYSSVVCFTAINEKIKQIGQGCWLNAYLGSLACC